MKKVQNDLGEGVVVSEEPKKDWTVRITCMLLAAALAGAASPGFAEDLPHRLPTPTCDGQYSPCPVKSYDNRDKSGNLEVRGVERCKERRDGSLHCLQEVPKLSNDLRGGVSPLADQLRGGVPRLGSPR
jgi:hypothetical protein